jgi:taurine transport system ATP-binding protein
MGSDMDLREVKKSEGYIETRDEILSIIWEMEEEIMGRVDNN